MRADGAPCGVTVARVMALGSGSLARKASSIQRSNWRNGSRSAWVSERPARMYSCRRSANFMPAILPAEHHHLAERYAAVRAQTEALAAPLSAEDCALQSMSEASPVKWHLGHTSWFFDTFVLGPQAGKPAHFPHFRVLFNSYYEGEGERHPRAERGLLSRPSLDEIRAWRAYVDEALAAALPRLPQAALALVELGLNHEQQHQELMLMDLTAAFAENPLRPAVWPAPAPAPAPLAPALQWVEGRRGLVEIGHGGGGFAFDCEGPRHQALLHPHALADRLVTNAEWLGFIDD